MRDILTRRQKFQDTRSGCPKRRGGGSVLCRGPLTLNAIATVAAPCLPPAGARNAAHGTLARGCHFLNGTSATSVMGLLPKALDSDTNLLITTDRGATNFASCQIAWFRRSGGIRVFGRRGEREEVETSLAARKAQQTKATGTAGLPPNSVDSMHFNYQL